MIEARCRLSEQPLTKWSIQQSVPPRRPHAVCYRPPTTIHRRLTPVHVDPTTIHVVQSLSAAGGTGSCSGPHHPFLPIYSRHLITTTGGVHASTAIVLTPTTTSSTTATARRGDDSSTAALPNAAAATTEPEIVRSFSAGDSSTHRVFLPHLPSLTKAHAVYLKSNNIFAPYPVPSGFNPSPRPTQQQGPSPPLNLPRTYETHSPFRVSSLSSSHAPTQNQNQNRPIQVKTKKELGKNEAHLAALFANRDDGQDTFGNIGPLRCGILFFCLLPWV